MTATLIDIGANLTHKSFRQDLPAVLARAREAGVAKILVTGTSLEASQSALELAREHPGYLVSTAGIHPHDAKHANDRALASLARLAREPGVVAVGECGLDYDRDFSPRPDQRKAFEAQLEIAEELKKPLFLHERSAHDDFAAILERHRPRLGRVVVHCFTGTERELRAYLDLDCDIGVTGWIADERRGLHLREIIGLVPAGKLLIETDAPFLLPRNMRPRSASRRNEPAFLVHVLEAVASALGRPRDDIARETTRAARDVFGLE